MTAADVAAASFVTLGAMLGVVLTALTLPGTWLAILISLLCWWWRPELLSWWTVGPALALAVGAEVAEGLSSAAGSGRSGGSGAGLVGSLVGSFAGLIVGQVLIPVPILGAVIGGIVGAGVGAVIGEVGVARRTWADAYRSGRGAAIGRAVSTLVKTGFAVVLGLLLAVAAWA